MAGNKQVNSDLEILGKVIVSTVPNNTGTVLTYNAASKEISQRTNAQFIDDLGLISATNIAAAYYTKAQLQTSGQAQVNWGNLTDIPPTFVPSAHTHDDRYYTEAESDLRFALDSNTVHKTGTETIDGEKEFLKSIKLNNLYKQGGGTKVFHHVYAQSLGNAQPVGMLSIKIPLATVAQTAFNVSITIQGRESGYLGTIEVGFFRSTATNIYQAKAVIRANAQFPSEVINMGHDAAGVMCLLIGDTTTAWGRYLVFSVDKVQTSHTGWAANWAEGWSHTFETSTTGFTSFQPVDIERLLIFEKTKVINTTGSATNSKISTYNSPQNSAETQIRTVENPIETGPLSATGALVIKFPGLGNTRVRGYIRDNLGRTTSFEVGNYNYNVTGGVYLSNSLFINKVRLATKGTDYYLIINDIDSVWSNNYVVIEDLTFYGLLNSLILSRWNKSEAFSIEVLSNLTGYTVGNLMQFLDVVATESYVDSQTNSQLNNYYTKTQLQTPGQSQVNWGNLTDIPSGLVSNSHTHSNKTFLDTVIPDTLVTNLNADLLDGKHLYEILASMVDKVVSNSTYTGLQNGTNKNFILPDNFVENSTRVYLNGVRQRIGDGNDYTESGQNTIIFDYPPDINDNIVIDYIKQ